MKPLAIDLYAGLGGWTDGLLAEGWDVTGYDIERHEYGSECYPARLILEDVRRLNGAQFSAVDLIVASPPCQEFSFMAMPWSRAKTIARALRGNDAFPDGYKGSRTIEQLTELFDACFRIQREACAAAGRHIPMVVENVRGAIPWVGRSRWNFGSFHLWGNVPALMPMAKSIKNNGGSWFAIANSTTSGCGNNARDALVDGIKQHKSGRAWFADPDTMSGKISSKSSARKAASAMIAKIPLPLSRYIGRTYYPASMGRAA